jgi:hypothetical protein
MSTGRISVERRVDCPASAAADYLYDALREAENGGKAAILRAGPLRRGVTLTFGTRSETVDGREGDDEIALRWASRMSLVPDFRGTITSRADGDGTLLVLDGTYVPPGHWLGAFIDEIAGYAVAGATGRDLLRRLGALIEQRERVRSDQSNVSALRGSLPARR